MYHEGIRALQDRFRSRQLADRMVDCLRRDRSNDEDEQFTERVGFFFLATADAKGQPDRSFKGGPLGFVRFPQPDLLVFPDYDESGMFKSNGNIKANPHVGLLFITMGAHPRRLRVDGRASLDANDGMKAEFPGAQQIIRVIPENIFQNCPRHIPDLGKGRRSEYLPVAGAPPKEPAWQGFKAFKDVVPPHRR